MYVHRYAKIYHFPIDFAIFTKALRTDQQTDQRTDKPSYKDAIAASKNSVSIKSNSQQVLLKNIVQPEAEGPYRMKSLRV